MAKTKKSMRQYDMRYREGKLAYLQLSIRLLKQDILREAEENAAMLFRYELMLAKMIRSKR